MNSKKKINTQPLSGFMELRPGEQILFNRIKDSIEKNYQLFGFIPMDNPVIERREVLSAKAGGETETQIYELQKGDNDLALRFDLTVPLARYVADKYGDLTFPFKRYQIAKVYRGEKPQAGRFREFYQADIDIIGNETLDISFDAEVPATIIAVFRDLGFEDFTIRINNRKIFDGLFMALQLEEKSHKIMNIIDRMEKEGAQSVQSALRDLDISEDLVDTLFAFLQISGGASEVLSGLRNLEIKNDMFLEGLSELDAVVQNLLAQGIDEKYFIIDPTIARGLGYYTGTVYETRFNNYPEIGSVCSGGRYDNLASEYTSRKLPGVGMSIGLSRLFDQFLKKGLIDQEGLTHTKVFVVTMDDQAKKYGLDLVAQLRKNQIPSEIDLNTSRNLKKRMKYADNLKIPFVMLIGEDEVKSGTYSVKNYKTGGETKDLSLQQLIQLVQGEV